MSDRFEITQRIVTRAGVRYDATDSRTGMSCRLWRLGERDTGMQVDAGTFAQAAGILPGLQHPVLVPVLTLEQDEEGWFAACAAPEGESLLDTVSRGPLRTADVSMIALDVLTGLAALEQAGLPHGCPDPDRIRLVRNAQRLAARLDEPGLAPLEKNSRGGAPFGQDVRFAAPELLAGQPASWLTDCYTAGAALYLAATRQAPVEAAEAAEALTLLATQTVRPVRDLRKDLPPPLASLIMRLMAPHPGDRPADAATALEWLRAALGMRGTGNPPRAMPVIRLRPLPIDPAELPSAPALPASLESAAEEPAPSADSPETAAAEPETLPVLTITDDMITDVEPDVQPGIPEAAPAEPVYAAEPGYAEAEHIYAAQEPVYTQAPAAVPPVALPPPPPPPRAAPAVVRHYRPVRQGMGPAAAVMLGLFCAGGGVGGFLLWQHYQKAGQPGEKAPSVTADTDAKPSGTATDSARPAPLSASRPEPKTAPPASATPGKTAAAQPKSAPPKSAPVKEKIFVRNFDSSKAPPREFSAKGTLTLRAAPDSWAGAENVLQCHTEGRGGELTMSLPASPALNLAEQGLQVFFELGLEPASQTALDSIRVALRTKNGLHTVELDISLTGGPLGLSAVAGGKPLPQKARAVGTTAALSPRAPIGFMLTLLPAGNDLAITATSGHASADLVIPPTAGLDRDFAGGSLQLTLPASISGILADNFTFTALK